ncbi:MAG: carbohydrate kinase family protein [Gammaproteobacteria bacterium]
MTEKIQVSVFGEVLFDCFPSGEKVLGGAPFNVAWHLQALGDSPRFISRVGYDELGRQILAAMADWGMDATAVQLDPRHQTGRVEIEVIDGEPHYDITPDCAYDFIEATDAIGTFGSAILYHGSLALRNPVSRKAFLKLVDNPASSIFLDVNLRPPWWRIDDVYGLLERARWVKLNSDELGKLGFASSDFRDGMADLKSQFDLEQVILTRGADGAEVLDGEGGFHRAIPERVSEVVDTVGAGDAFSAVYIHGLIRGWPVAETVDVAQRFAGTVIGLRGATSSDPAFYRDFV